MENITIELAFKIREQLRNQLVGGQCRQEVDVIANILAGEYDKHRDAITMAHDDLVFMKEYIGVKS